MRRLALSGLLFGLALGGCAATRPADAPVVLRLAPVTPPVPQPQPIVVATVQVRGLSGDRRYTYVDRMRGSELRQARTLFWEEPPSAVVERALIGALGAPVLATGRPQATDRRLVARLFQFEERTGGASGAEAVVTVDAEVLAASDRRVLGSGRYCAHAPVEGPAPSERAHAFERAIADVARMVAQDAAAGLSRGVDCAV